MRVTVCDSGICCCGVHVTFSECSNCWFGLKEADKMVQLNWNSDSRLSVLVRFVQQRALLSKALEVFQQTQDHFGIGECLLLQSRLEQDEKLMQRALQSFRPSGQQPNFAGIVECIEVSWLPMSQFPSLNNLENVQQWSPSFKTSLKASNNPGSRICSIMEGLIIS